MQDDLNAVVQAFLEMKGDFKSRQEQVSRDTVWNPYLRKSRTGCDEFVLDGYR